MDTDLVWPRVVNFRLGPDGPGEEAPSDSVAVRNRFSDSLKLGPDSMALSSPERASEEK